MGNNTDASKRAEWRESPDTKGPSQGPQRGRPLSPARVLHCGTQPEAGSWRMEPMEWPICQELGHSRGRGRLSRDQLHSSGCCEPKPSTCFLNVTPFHLNAILAAQRGPCPAQVMSSQPSEDYFQHFLYPQMSCFGTNGTPSFQWVKTVQSL